MEKDFGRMTFNLNMGVFGMKESVSMEIFSLIPNTPYIADNILQFYITYCKDKLF